MIKRGMLLGLLAVVLSGCSWIGNGYSHVVDRPQSEVVAALEDLDISAQPGNPGTDPSRSGGVKPDIRLEKASDHMTWWVMAGDKVATIMTVTFEQLDGGKRTRVTTSVKRGDAPDDIVSPAFRSHRNHLAYCSRSRSRANSTSLPTGRARAPRIAAR